MIKNSMIPDSDVENMNSLNLKNRKGKISEEIKKKIMNDDVYRIMVKYEKHISYVVNLIISILK